MKAAWYEKQSPGIRGGQLTAIGKGCLHGRVAIALNQRD